jgi:hypothetical protein
LIRFFSGSFAEIVRAIFELLLVTGAAERIATAA